MADVKGCARCNAPYEGDENWVFNELCNRLTAFHCNTNEPPRTCSKSVFTAFGSHDDGNRTCANQGEGDRRTLRDLFPEHEIREHDRD